MMKKLAAKIAPFVSNDIAITAQPQPKIIHNQEESICELQVWLLVRNSTTYDVRFQAGEVELSIGSAVYTRIHLPRIISLRPGHDTTIYLRKALTEFEYGRAVKLFRGQQKADCQLGVSLQGETVFGPMELQRGFPSSLDLVETKET